MRFRTPAARVTAFVVALSGVLLTGFSIRYSIPKQRTFALRWRSPERPDLNLAPQSESRSVKPPEFHLSVPASVAIGRPFLIELEFQGTPQPELFETEFQLSAAGLDIEPEKQWMRPTMARRQNSLFGVVRWSARAPTTGSFIVLVNTRFSEAQVQKAFDAQAKWFNQADAASLSLVDREMRKQVEQKTREMLTLPQSLAPAIDPVTVNVKPTFVYYTAKTMPLLGTFFGSLLTLPGFLAFKENREAKRKERLRIEIASDLPPNRQIRSG